MIQTTETTYINSLLNVTSTLNPPNFEKSMHAYMNNIAMDHVI